MDPQFLHYYNQELRHVREMGEAFATAYPKVAGRLGMHGIDCADPYVERLLEGFAFLTARVQMKLDARHPVFTRHLLDMLYPGFLLPMPSMAVVEMQPDPTRSSTERGVIVPRGSLMRARRGREGTQGCRYRSAHAVRLLPLTVSGVRYLPSASAIAAVGLAVPAGLHPRAALRLTFDVAPDVGEAAVILDGMELFLGGKDDVPGALYELVLGHGIGFTLRQDDEVTHKGADAIHPRGFDADDALLPRDGRTFSGHRLLREYLVCPQRFLFVALGEPGGETLRCRAGTFELTIWLDQAVDRLEPIVDASHIRLHCTPAINLFEHDADRVVLHDGATEFHVVADRTQPMDFEVYDVIRARGYGDGGVPPRRLYPFYGGNLDTWHARDRNYYTLRREARLVPARQRREGARSSYMGSETFLSLVDGQGSPSASAYRQLGLRLLCTQRDLPLHMPIGHDDGDFFLEKDAPVTRIRCVAGPTWPKDGMAEGRSAWKLISHLQLDHTGYLQGGDAGRSLRELLVLLGDSTNDAAARASEGVREVRARPVVRRVPSTRGPAVHTRGLEVTMTCDESAFGDTGAYLFGAVLARFFARQVSVHSFTETTLRTMERGDIGRWPACSGTRPLL